MVIEKRDFPQGGSKEKKEEKKESNAQVIIKQMNQYVESLSQIIFLILYSNYLIYLITPAQFKV